MSARIGLYLSNNQIQTLKSQQKLVSCEPLQRLEKIDSNLISDRKNSVGQIFDVVDDNGKTQAKAKLSECFITTYGAPDSKLVSGMGFGSNTQEYKSEYITFWQQNFPTESLDESTELFISIWEYVQ